MRILFFSILFFSSTLFAQTPEIITIRKYRQVNEHRIMKDYFNFLSIPNVASDTTSLLKNAYFISDKLKTIGVKQVQLLYPNTKGIPPAVYGEINVPNATQTVIFYAHYDGQPVDSSKWFPGLHPFKPILMDGIVTNGAKAVAFPDKSQAFNPEWRIYGRGASDDKAGVMSIVTAYEAIIASGLFPKVNVKFFFEGEEEAGSDHLFEILEQNKSLLQSDLWVICDGPVHQTGKKLVVFGVRGDTHLELTTFGPLRPLHSGHYGNWAPNPAMELAQLLSTMKDKNGKVTIKGFYDDVLPLSAMEKAAIKAIPPVETQLKNELGFLNEESLSRGLTESINLPSLNINGLQSANVGKLSANVIPTKAIASIDLRLVAGNDWQRQQQKVINHIKSLGYFVTEKEPTIEERKSHSKIIQIVASSGYNAQKTPMDLPMARMIIAALQATTNEQVILTPTSGGSLPLFVFEKYLNAKTISIPVANHDNNQHAENENIRLKNLFEGIETMAAIMLQSNK
ncbi:MAG: M20/M25/M40 family metallo-hydrolase [Chitinophagaceae bacterium]|nr:M20/M25/M40 family metallo-hydrolase [Chitinophagaceae bacterium]